MIDYGFVKWLDLDFDAAVELVEEQLQSEGFCVLTKIDVKQELGEKLGIDFRRYIILGTCDVANACKAIMAEENIGLMLPCNVIIYECDGGTAIGVVRPTMTMQMIDNLDVKRVAKDVERRLKSVLDAMQPVVAAP